eukprot:jgi/Astpho2/8624/Aster-x1534
MTLNLLQEARFDRHFVRDLVWSRHQLEELAKRRFIAAQRAARGTAAGEALGSGENAEALKGSFNDLFKKVGNRAPGAERVSVADFSGYLSRLSTPRELMIMMTELFARIEAKPHEQLKAEDLEISVSSALQQAVA